ncbi:MAG: hypothetical protein QE278_07865 [Limnobacter sp.]|nr:hypothetical protein [Limnobacter sp.]
MSIHLRLTLLGCLLGLTACSSTSLPQPEVEPAQDLSTVLSRFDALRQEMKLPLVRLSLEPNPFVAAAKGINSMVMDEEFAYSLSDPALNFVLIHEFAHLKYQDPRAGYTLLRKLNEEEGGETTTDFMLLWGKYSNNPEFQAMVKEVESRADQYAVEYLHANQQDACAAGQELEAKTGRSFGDRIQAMCDATALKLAEQAQQIQATEQQPEQQPQQLIEQIPEQKLTEPEVD